MTDVQQLVAQLGDADPGRRADAADGLRALGDRSAEGALVRALSDPDPDVRTAAAYALGRVGGSAAVPALVLASQDDDGEVWDNALLSLVDIGEPAVTYVVGLAKSVDEGQRVVAFTVLAELTKVDDQRLVTAVYDGLRDPSARVRAIAARSIPGPDYSPLAGQFATLLPELAGLAADDPAPEVRATAARTLERRTGQRSS